MTRHGDMWGLPQLALPAGDWQQQAACRDEPTGLWFPEGGYPGAGREAKECCARCPVRAECLEYAVANNIRHGIWGGLGVREREGLRVPVCRECHQHFVPVATPASVARQRICRPCAAELDRARRRRWEIANPEKHAEARRRIDTLKRERRKAEREARKREEGAA